ncbi:hypothetical protein ACHAXH_002032 [Discostella pseudostelligera]
MSNSRSTTQEMLTASENGVVVTSNSDANSSCKSSSPSDGIRKQLLRVDTNGDEICTLKTFTSVGESIKSDTSFIFSKMSEARLSTRSNSGYDRETRKRLHYKEKLRALTERLASNAAVDRSRQVLTIMADGEKQVQEDAASVATQDDDDDDIETKLGRICGSLRKKLMACTMNICVHDAIVDPEGLMISVTHKILNLGGEESSSNTENDGFNSEVSSLTDETYHRYLRHRYY